MRVTSKGQVTIPQNIREKAGLLPHTEVSFEYRNGVVRLVKTCKSAKSRGNSLVKKLTGKGDVKMTTEEIMALTRAD